MELEFNVAYRCENRDIAKAWLKEAEELGWRWWGGDFKPTSNTYWGRYRSSTCYLNRGSGIICCSSEWFKKNGYSVVDYIPNDKRGKKMKATAIMNIDGKEEKREIELTGEQAKLFKQSKVWAPIVGDLYYFINSDGKISRCILIGTPAENYRLKTNNCKQTKEESEFKRERDIVIAELDNYAEEHNEPIDWGNTDQYKYSIGWDYNFKEIRTYWTVGFKGGGIYFSSEEIAKAAVKAIRPDRVKKYYLKVEE